MMVFRGLMEIERMLLVILYILIKTRVVRCYYSTINNNGASEQVTRDKGNHHLVNMLPWYQWTRKRQKRRIWLWESRSVEAVRTFSHPQSTPNEDRSMRFWAIAMGEKIIRNIFLLAICYSWRAVSSVIWMKIYKKKRESGNLIKFLSVWCTSVITGRQKGVDVNIQNVQTNILWRVSEDICR